MRDAVSGCHFDSPLATLPRPAMNDHGTGSLFSDPSADRARAGSSPPSRAPRRQADDRRRRRRAVWSTMAITWPSAASAATAFRRPSCTRSSARRKQNLRLRRPHRHARFSDPLCRQPDRPRQDAGRGRHRLRRRPGGARPVAARPAGDGIRRGRVHRVEQLRAGRALQGRGDGRAVPAGALDARHRHVSPQRRAR